MNDERFDAWLRKNAPKAPPTGAEESRALDERISRIPNPSSGRRLARWVPSLAVAAGLLAAWISPRLSAPARQEQAIATIAGAYEAWLEEEKSREEAGDLLTLADEIVED